MNKYLLNGLFMVLILLIITFAGPYLPFIDHELNGERIVFPEGGGIGVAPFPPSEDFLLGSDREGRDMLSLIIMGAKDTFKLVILIVLIRYAVAVPLGLLGTSNKGFFPWLLRWWNQLFSGFPVIISAALILCLPPLLYHEHRLVLVILILALIEVGRVGLLVQKQSHQISQKSFVEAGITIGVKPGKMIAHYYLPNLLPDVIVNFFSDAARVIMLIGQLAILNIFISFDVFFAPGLGFMFENTSLDWASLIKDARKDAYLAFWIPFFPMLAIVIGAFTFNLLGEGLRKHFNRHLPS
ncbi:ABC transporter permease [Cytobacillus purgationiresistens]|uniref:Peptide/nickel transport system permease protein n=1 Tax=Cytobacillus purgationiresistens TaxID=863449 RepID=A0ABU0ANH4_9BACI|nr:ABC transporter permease subunit [Cytobacillus purgationiresistens]MDQ0271953.1 peptide/nickel transport system permease protein [Cytobacillus purgationiresistens]